RSPGMAPPTSMTRPSARAIIRPPAAGLSIVSVSVWPVVSTSSGLLSIEGDSRQPAAFAHQSVDGAFARAGKRLWRHAGAKRRQRRLGVLRHSGERRIIEGRSRALEKIRIERR